MRQLKSEEFASVSGGIAPLLAYYLYMGSSISSTYSVMKWLGKQSKKDV